ncbi:MAG: HAMP domain-containing histidine kinase, partial [Algicola sp.]|nr:HAMP domain-containing histidine kinase [Algicola sp.]
TQGEIILSIKPVKGSVYLNYQDNCCGISPEQLQLIYEPFYTTKRGKGLTGLGLHIVYNCVAQSLKGTIICKSEVVKGTEFEIKFPVRPGKSNSVQTI